MSAASSLDDHRSDLIDAYLIRVENALVAAGAPRADRMQVLQNLETQIEEMLQPHPLPFTVDTIRAVLDKLEPPSHFAAMYSNGGKRHDSASPTSSPPQRSFRLARPERPKVAAVCVSSLVLSVMFGLIVGASGPNVFWIVMTLLSGLVGFVITPIALWKAYRQLRSDPTAPGRNLVINTAIVYGTLAPILLVLVAGEATNGAAPLLFGIAAFFYAQYVLLRRLWKHLSDALPASPTATTTTPTGHNTTSSVHPTTPMPAM
jgi:hypothetical protein